jgi:subtilisin family serine protease
VVLKMALGESPAGIPAAADVRSGRLAAAQSLDGGVVDRIVRHFAGGMRFTRVHASAAGLARPGARHLRFDDAEEVFGLARTFRVDVPAGTPIADLVDSLNQVTTVESAAPNYVAVTPFAAAATGLAGDEDATPWEMVRAAEALAYEPGDVTVIVGIVDTGVSREHPELAGKLRSGVDTVQLGGGELALGIQLLGDRRRVDTDPTDDFVGHGMGCAGIVGALGLGMPPGLAGHAQVLPMRGLGAARFPGVAHAVGVGATTDLDMAVKLAVDLSAKVINLSFGTDDAVLEPGAEKPHADVVAYALDRGRVLVAAAGNEAGEKTYWPAAFPGVIAVGSVGPGRRPSGFSSRGPHVALCAPGERVRTLGLTAYQQATGTSFAAPFVAGAAALLVARAEARSMPVDSLLVRQLLVHSAAPFGGRPVEGCGAGVLDAYAALRTLDVHIDRSLEPGDGPIGDG